MAFTVCVLATVTGPLYTVPVLGVGVEPSTVYRIDAPEVVVEMATVCVDVYVPAAGLNVGVDAIGQLLA